MPVLWRVKLLLALWFPAFRGLFIVQALLTGTTGKQSVRKDLSQGSALRDFSLDWARNRYFKKVFLLPTDTETNFLSPYHGSISFLHKRSQGNPFYFGSRKVSSVQLLNSVVITQKQPTYSLRIAGYYWNLIYKIGRGQVGLLSHSWPPSGLEQKT